jgi:hypothetical protein
MKQLAYIVLFAILVLSSGYGYARNTILRVSIGDALTLPEAASRIDDSIRLYFGDQAHPQIVRTIGTYTSNKKTNAFGKTDTFACQWAFLSAMMSLQQRARNEGGNAVVNIRSYYYKNRFSSATEFECGAGAVIAGVTMIGDVVELEQ